MVLRLAPGARVITPHPSRGGAVLKSRGGGQSMLVIAGVLAAAGKTLDRCSALFVGADEQPLEVVASAEGADLLVLQYPRQSPA